MNVNSPELFECELLCKQTYLRQICEFLTTMDYVILRRSANQNPKTQMNS